MLCDEHMSHQLLPPLLLQITLAMASLIFYLAWWMFYVWRAQKSLKQKLYSEHKMGHMHINLMVRSGLSQGLCLPCNEDLCCQHTTLSLRIFTAGCLCTAMTQEQCSVPVTECFHALITLWASLTGCCLCLQKRRRLWGRLTVAAFPIA